MAFAVEAHDDSSVHPHVVVGKHFKTLKISVAIFCHFNEIKITDLGNLICTFDSQIAKNHSLKGISHALLHYKKLIQLENFPC